MSHNGSVQLTWVGVFCPKFSKNFTKYGNGLTSAIVQFTQLCIQHATAGFGGGSGSISGSINDLMYSYVISRKTSAVI